MPASPEVKHDAKKFAPAPETPFIHPLDEIPARIAL
jgi:hypothetical protein